MKAELVSSNGYWIKGCCRCKRFYAAEKKKDLLAFFVAAKKSPDFLAEACKECTSLHKRIIFKRGKV